MVVKKSLEIVTEQVHLDGSFKRGGRIRVVECLRHMGTDQRLLTLSLSASYLLSLLLVLRL